VVRADRESQDRRVGGIALAVGRRRGQVARQKVRGRVDGGLHVLLGRVDVAIQIELQGDERGVEARHRGHLTERRDLAELAFQRRGDRGDHGLGAGAGQAGGHHDGRVVDLGQGRHRQLRIAHESGEQHADHEQRGRDGAPDEGFGDAHGFFASRVAPGALPAPLPLRSARSLVFAWLARLDQGAGLELELSLGDHGFARGQARANDGELGVGALDLDGPNRDRLVLAHDVGERRPRARAARPPRAQRARPCAGRGAGAPLRTDWATARGRDWGRWP
jgi:hypothetical protein